MLLLKKHKVIPCCDCYKSERSSDPLSHQHKSTLILTDFCECLTVNHESNLSGCTLGVYTTSFILDIRIWERSTTWLYSPWNMARHWPCLSKLTSTLIALGPCFITIAFAYPYDDIGMCNVPWQSTIDLLSSLSFSAFFFYKSCGASTKTQFFHSICGKILLCIASVNSIKLWSVWLLTLSSGAIPA